VYKSDTFNKNDLVLVCIRDRESIKILHKFGLPYTTSKTCQLPFLLKKIAAKSGDIVQISNSGIVVNNKLVPNTVAVIKYKNIYLNPLSIGAKYILGKHDYFLLGLGNNSYDSRYFGVVHAADLSYKAILFWPIKQPIWQAIVYKYYCHFIPSRERV
jgi:type IV secretory pathway protease TraF